MSWNKFKSKWKDGNLEFIVTNGNTSADYILDDNIKLTLGTGSDAKIYWNGSELQGPNPTSGMWANCPSLAYSDISDYYQWTEDFMQLVIDDTISDPLGWTVNTENSGAITLKTGEYGGVVHVSTSATDNDQCCMQIGTGAVGTTVEITDASGLELWYECRVKTTNATELAVFIGLAEENVATDLIADNGAASFANKDCIGFSKNTDAATEWDFQYHLAGYVRYTDAKVKVNSSGTFNTFGFHFNGASVLTPYVNGTAQTVCDTSAASFPSGEEMAPIVAIKTGTGASKSIDVDWIRIVGQR